MIEMRSPWKRAFALVADALLAIAARGLVRARTANIPANPRILVVRCDHIGDAVMATVVLEPLRRAFAPAKLDLLVGPWSAGAFRGHAHIDDLLVYAAPWWSAARNAPLRERIRGWLELLPIIRRIRGNRYDIAIDLRGDLRQIFFFLALSGSGERVSTDRTGGRRLLTRCFAYDPSLHLVEQNIRIIELLEITGNPKLDLPTPPALPSAIRDRIADVQGTNGFVALTLKGNNPNKGWPNESAARLVELLRHELELGAVFVGGAPDRPIGDAIAALSRAPILNLAGETTLSQALGVFATSQVTVAVDSGPMHLAAAAGAAVVALFGPTNPSEVHAWTPRRIIISEGAPCGCIHPTCDWAPSGPGRCMTRISPEQVRDAVRDLMMLRESSSTVRQQTAPSASS